MIINTTSIFELNITLNVLSDFAQVRKMQVYNTDNEVLIVRSIC